MAEGDQGSLLEEIYSDKCDPCLVDGRNENATSYCTECKEHLCSTCVGYHRRMGATKSHELVDVTEKRNCPEGPAEIKCVFHPERTVEMYCGTHDMVFCLECVVHEHRACNGLCNIGDIPTKQVHNEIHRLQEDIQRFHNNLEEAFDSRQQNIEAIQKQEHDISNKMREVEQKLIEHIKYLTTKDIQTLNTTCLEAQDDLVAINTTVKDMLEEVENLTKRLESAGSMDISQRFALSKLTKKSLKEIQRLYHRALYKGSKAVYFTENVELQSLVNQATSVGQTHVITENAKPSTRGYYKVKSKIWVDVRAVSDKSKCVISDICLLPDGTVLLADHGNKNLKRLDTDYNIQSHFDLEAIPTGICCTGRQEVCAKLNNNKLQFISIQTKLDFLREIKIKDGSYYGLSFFCGELWVSRKGGIDIYNTMGALIKSFEKDVEGVRIFKTDTIQHMAVRGSIVIVTDNADGAIAFNKDGDVTAIFRDASLNGARGVCVSNTGTVFISGYRSDNIVMFNGDGTCLGELVAKDAAMKLPISLTYDSNKDNIFVSCENTNIINIFELE